MKQRRYVYKIVRPEGNHFKSAFIEDPAFIVHYYVNKRTTAKTGKLMAFKSIPSATECMEGHPDLILFRATATGISLAPEEIPCSNSGPEAFNQFWNHHHSLLWRGWGYGIPPDGTVVCHSITLIKQLLVKETLL